MVEDKKAGWDEDDVQMQLAHKIKEQYEADQQQLIRKVENFGSEHSKSPHSSITDPWVEESKGEAEKEAVAPLRMKPSWHLVPRDTPGPEANDLVARSHTRARTRVAQGLGLNLQVVVQSFCRFAWQSGYKTLKQVVVE